MDNGNTADVVCLDFARAFDPICLCDKDVLSDGKNLLTVSGRCVVAGDKDQEWGTSEVSDRAISILVACQRPSKYYQCDKASFRRRRRAPSTMSGIGR